MKLLTLIYDEALDNQITPIFRRTMTVTRYSKIEGVVGARMEMMAEMDLPQEGRNNIILLVTDDATMERILADLRDLRETVREGMRGIVTKADVVV